MKTNLFKVKKYEDKKVILEEEQTKNPFILFIKRNSKLLILLLLLLGVSTVGLGLGLGVSLIGNTGDFDISYIAGSSEIDAIPDTNDKEVSDALLGNLAIKDGVVLQVDKFMTDTGDIITYYSDNTALVIKSTGEIIRVAPLLDGNYGVNKKGIIDDNAITKTVTSNTNTLNDGTIITYLSDGSAEITKDKTIIFVRDSKNITFDPTKVEQVLTKIIPSGVSLVKEKTNNNGYTKTEFQDGSILIEDNNGNKYLVHNDIDINLNANSYSFPNNNASTIINSKKMTDNKTVEYYTDGSAIITDSDGNQVFVRMSGDIVEKNDKVFEIIPQKRYDAVSTLTSPDGKTVTYYNNGDAIIKSQDRTREYVKENSNIKYDSNKNITNITTDISKQKTNKIMTDGTDVTDFDNNKTNVIDLDGNDYIIDKSYSPYDMRKGTKTSSPETSTSETTKPPRTSKTTEGSSIVIEDIDDGEIEMGSATNDYNYTNSLEITSFTIKNTGSYPKDFRLVIEEVSDYSKYGATPITSVSENADEYIKIQATVGSKFISGTNLASRKIEPTNGNNTYLIYEGKIGAKNSSTGTLNVNVILYINYAPLNNDYQNKAFIGTIKLYQIKNDISN